MENLYLKDTNYFNLSSLQLAVCQFSGKIMIIHLYKLMQMGNIQINVGIDLIIGPRYTWGPIYGSECL